MAIKSLEQRKHQKTLLIVALGILIVAVAVFYFGVWQKGGKGKNLPLESTKTDQKTGMVLKEKLMEINLDFSYLKQAMLPFLKPHGDLPVEKGETGRTNPFIPY